MKIYIDFKNQVITKTSNENVMLGDIYSNVFELLFYNFGTDTDWFPTLSQLAPNGRSAGDFSADALGIGETHNYTEDGVNYLKYDFTIGDGYVNMSGRSMFYIWVNRTTPVMSRKGIAKVNVNIDASTDTPFITDPLFNPAVKTYIDACVAEIGDGSPKYFDTAANIALLTEDKGLAVATDTGHLYYWDSTSTSTTKYTDSGLVYNDLSAYYTKTQSDNKYAQLGANNTFTGDNEFRGDSLFSDDINQAYGDFSTQGNVEAQSFTKNGTNLDDIYASKSNTYTKTESDILLNEKANKSNTYTKSEVNTALDAKADKTNTYTKSQVDTALNDKVNTSDFDTLDGRVDDIEDDIDTLKSVQNVVDVVATKSALNSYNTSKLEENDKIQVIADETHSGASTIYNWNGSAWEYLGAYGGNSYTKTQTDNLLNAKADKSTTYTKTETDTLLNTKADKSTTYTKAEIDTILNTIVIEKHLESLAVDQITIRGYVTQEVFNSIGPRTQVQLRVYDSDNDMTFILTQNSPGTNGYNFKCTFNSPIDADGMIEAEGAIYEDREYSFGLRNIKIYTEAEVDTLLSSKLNKANPTGTGSISMNSGTASGIGSYANGWGATASGDFSIALGFGTIASGVRSIGISNDATGDYSISHAPNGFASGDYSRALGNGAKAKGDNQTVIGKFNIPDTSSLEIVGCGEAINGDNARLLDANGNEYLKGDLYINTTFTKDANGDLVSKKGTSITELFNNFRWELGSHTLDVESDTDVAFSKSVPNYTIGCQINKIGGMCYKSENLLELENDNSYGIVYGNNFVVGQTYTLKLFTKVYRVKIATSSSQPAGDCLVSLENNNGLTTATFTYANGSNWNLYLWGYGTSDSPNAGLLSDISTVQPMIVKGSTAPTSYEPYFSGIRDSAVTQITLKDSNNTTKSTISIPTAIQNLTGYGWGISESVCNYIDYDNKKFVQKVGRIDLGTLTWSYTSADNLSRFYATLSGAKLPIDTATLGNILLANYENVTWNNFVNATLGKDMSASLRNDGALGIRDLRYTDENTFKTAMSGGYLYYELATPIETDISSYITNDTIDVEPLGTLEFTNTYSQDVPSDIDYLIEEVKA